MKSTLGTWSLSLMLINSYSCTLDCGDGEDLSPEELINFCDYVATGRCVGIDTLINLGQINYLGLDSPKAVLAFGKILKPNDEMANIMSNMTNMYFLKELRKGKSFDEIMEDFLGNELLRKQAGFVSGVPFNTYKADTSIAALIESKQEVLGNMVKQRQQDGTVIYGIDELTFSSFEYGILCYYDKEGWPRTKYSQDYVDELRSTIKRYYHEM
ncbi:MAG: hypothetical protein ACREOO_00780 [bacterium]